MKTISMFLCCIALMCSSIFAHCQIPCGIYDDSRQFSELKEHVKTIEKSMASISTLTDNQNQIARWVSNKESHATQIQDIVNHYFLIQRIKSTTKENGLSNNEYLNLLSAAHQVLVLSMKAKQQVNLDVSAQLLSQLESFETQYLAYKK